MSTTWQNKLFLTLTLVCITTLCNAQITALNGKKISEAAMDEYLKKQMDLFSIPGLSVAFINKGKVVYHRALGFANLKDSTRANSKTLFEAASMTKSVFAYYVMKLVDQKILSLDTPLYKYYPYPDVAYDDRYKLITARMVLSHRTGFPNWREQTPPDSVRNVPKGALYLKFLPGTKVSYSGEGFQYLAKTIAHLLKTDMDGLGNIMFKEVCVPLGMKGSSFEWNEHVQQYRAVGYTHPGDGNNKEGGLQKFNEINAAASLRSNALDFSRFLIGLVKGKGLRATSLSEMLKVQSTPADGDAWGLGINIRHTSYGDRYSHGGDNGNFTAYYVLYKNKKAGFVLFLNNNMVNALMGRVELFFSTGEAPPEKKSISVSAQILEQYVGKYQIDERKSMIITSKGGRLFMQQSNAQFNFELYPSSETRFFFRLDPAEISFIKDSMGKVVDMELHQGATTKKFKKIK
jgi:CubicO group peptidase (beta-lactamase class C family)